MKYRCFLRLMSAFVCATSLNCCSSLDESGVFKIGILQTASHPALDQAREGFIEGIQTAFGNEAQFVVYNAEGSIPQARMMAQALHINREIRVYFAIATPAAQCMAAAEKERPVVFAAVTDPKMAGLGESGSNVRGASDHINIPSLIDMLCKLIPQAKRIAILYNPSEVNSCIIKEEMQQELVSRGLEVVEYGVQQEKDASVAARLAVQKADVILTPTDNTIAMSISIIAKIARENRKPLIVSDNLLVAKGALAARGIDYKESGRQAAELVVEILRGLPLSARRAPQISPKNHINLDLLKELELTLPEGWEGV